jgi:hypothetical protein
MNSARSRTPRYLVWTAVIALMILHQDFWLWDNKSLLFGFLPVGLAYHMAFSLCAGLIWALAVKFAWPEHIEQWASEFEGGAGAPKRKAGGPHS